MKNLKGKRKDAKLSQTELGKLIGVGQQLVSFWELGKREIPVRHAKKLARVLGCDWKDLYD